MNKRFLFGKYNEIAVGNERFVENIDIIDRRIEIAADENGMLICRVIDIDRDGREVKCKKLERADNNDNMEYDFDRIYSTEENQLINNVVIRQNGRIANIQGIVAPVEVNLTVEEIMRINRIEDGIMDIEDQNGNWLVRLNLRNISIDPGDNERLEITENGIYPILPANNMNLMQQSTVDVNVGRHASCGIKREIAYVGFERNYYSMFDGKVIEEENRNSIYGFSINNRNSILCLCNERILGENDTDLIQLKIDRWNKEGNIDIVKYYAEVVFDLTNSRIIVFKYLNSFRDFTKRTINLRWGINGRYLKILSGAVCSNIYYVDKSNCDHREDDFNCSINMKLMNRIYIEAANSFQILDRIFIPFFNEDNWDNVYINTGNSSMRDINNFFYDTRFFEQNREIINNNNGFIKYKTFNINYDFENDIFTTLDPLYNDVIGI